MKKEFSLVKIICLLLVTVIIFSGCALGNTNPLPPEAEQPNTNPEQPSGPSAPTEGGQGELPPTIPCLEECALAPSFSFQFDSAEKLNTFLREKQQYLEGDFLVPDMDKVQAAVENVLWCAHSLMFDNELNAQITAEELDQPLTNARFVVEAALYSVELGHEDIADYDAPFLSLTFKCYSFGYTKQAEELSFEFSPYHNDKFVWNNRVVVRDGTELVCVFYYCEAVPIDQQWIQNFLLQNAFEF